MTFSHFMPYRAIVLTSSTVVSVKETELAISLKKYEFPTNDTPPICEGYVNLPSEDFQLIQLAEGGDAVIPPLQHLAGSDNHNPQSSGGVRTTDFSLESTKGT